MTDFLLRCKRFRIVQSALWVMLPSLVYADIPYSPPEKEEFLVAAVDKDKSKEDTYRINFKNIAIVEYIRFVAKITGSNFVFDENELQFTVTIVSEEPATPENVFSALVQVLRINNLNLLEQNGNYIITKNDAVKQIPEVVGGEIEGVNTPKVPLITRVFRIHNASLDSVAPIIRSMISAKALVSVVNESKQLIVTDITENIEKIASLLAILDSPHSPLEIESYAAKYVSVKDLVTLAQQIVSPFSDGNPLIYVPQIETNSIFIISTPYLLERSITVLQDLDLPPQPELLGAQAENVFIYKILHRPAAEILRSIQATLEPLQLTPRPPTRLITMLKSARHDEDSNSLLFIGDAETFAKINTILSGIDVLDQASASQKFFVYRLRYNNLPEIQNSLNQLITSLQQSPSPDLSLIKAIQSMRYIPDSASLVFTGDQASLNRLEQLLPSFDLAEPAVKITFFVYQPSKASERQIRIALDQFVNSLKSSKVPDSALINSIESMKFLPETQSFVFSGTQDTLNRLSQILPSLDAAAAKKELGSFYVYQIKFLPHDILEEALKAFAKKLASSGDVDPDLQATIKGASFVKETNSLYFSGTPSAIDRLQQILPTIDIASGAYLGNQSNFYIFTPQNANPIDFQLAITNLIDNLKTASHVDTALVQTLQSGKYFKETNSFTFTGTPDSIARLQQILPTLDVAPQFAKSSYYVYRIQNAKIENLERSFALFVKNLETAPYPDRPLIQAIQSMRFIKESNSIVFTGDQSALDRLARLLPDFDVPWAGTAPAGLPASNSFFIYTPVNKQGPQLMEALGEMVNNLKGSGLADPSLIRTLETAKWVPSSNTIVFTGDQAAIDKLKNLLPTIDSPSYDQSQQIFLYRPINLTYQELEQTLQGLTATLDSANPSDLQLKQTIASMRWEAASQSIAFKGAAPTIDRVKQLLAGVDVPPEGGFKQQIYFLYKLQYASADTTIAYLNKIASNLTGSSTPHKALVQAIKNIKVVPENNSILITGDSSSVEQVKQLIAQYDIPSAAQPGKGTVFIYKPKFMSPTDLQLVLVNLITDLSKTTTLDPQLLNTVQSAKPIDANQSIAFSGSSEINDQIKNLISEIDTPEAAKKTIQRVGEMTFYIYKLQYASAAQLTTALQTVATNLAKGGVEDKDLIQAINSMKWIKETNSVIFTGRETALQKIQELLPKFDIPSLATPTPGPEISDYSVYHPQYRTGEELIQMLCDFDNNLRLSGVSAPGVSSTINNLRWMESTCSLIISGDPDSISKVFELVKQFDVPSAQQAILSETKTLGETSFLVYKLQYHQGDDIRFALRKVAEDLIMSHRGQNLPVARAIEAMQWIQVTNSLLTSGPPEILVKVRELIQNLDIPLRQVFLEILILQTNLLNTQSLGLSWSGRVQYKDQVGVQGGNFQVPTDPLIASGLNSVSNTAGPVVNNFSTNQGLDLGAIGDIIFNKGKSFATLASFIQALEQDNDSTLITNPKVIAQDSNNATIFFGQNIPFTGSVTQTASNSITTSASLEYRNIGNSLSITPTLGNSDVVTLDIAVDLSSLIGPAPTTTINQVNGIQTNQSSMTTRVHVPDGWFVCLTGQIQDTKNHLWSGIPCLGGLPVIGAAFSNTARTNNRNNLLIFIRPQIIKTFEDYKQISQNQEALIKDRSGRTVHKEEIDEGFSWVKTPENE